MISTQLQGAFSGLDGNTVIQLMNGEQYQQVEYFYFYTYSFMPSISIVPYGINYKIKIDGIDREIEFKKIS